MTSNMYHEIGTSPEALPAPERALAIGAHPDDIEFGCGGTIAGWSEGGCEVTMLVVTDGSKGSWDPNTDPSELAIRRTEEQSKAAATLGVSRVVRLDYVDGELESTMELRRRICEQIRIAMPDVLLSHDPWQRYQVHPDHRATGLGAIDGMVAARDPLFFPEIEAAPHRPKAMLLWSADEPDYWSDISSTIDTKIAALLCHSSQGETTMGGAHSDKTALAAFDQRIRDWAAANTGPTNLMLAEAFKRLTP